MKTARLDISRFKELLKDYHEENPVKTIIFTDRPIKVGKDVWTFNISCNEYPITCIQEKTHHFLILTTNLDALLPTILSRCVTLNMKPVEDKLVKEFLMEQ